MNKFFSFLGLAKRSRNLLEGYSQCNEQRNKRKLYLFIISTDASDSTRGKFITHCKTNNIPYIEDFSKEELGGAIGREEIKILGVTDPNMGSKLRTLYEEEKYMK
jgi:ribosomal protein L7Ae-like RNA K-turn-binding protein